jgi:glycosyltransferase involved in cell wall biosynthesis
MPMISIIIPIYNVEKYLPRCLDSVLAQTFTDYECILVDDGSPDNCPAICDEYVRKDTRFRVIHKKQNEGLPKARKSGLDIAISEFVIHLDSDDWLEPNALVLLYKKQKETGADIVMGGFREIFKNYTEIYYYPNMVKSNDIISYFFLYRCKYLWGKLYKKQLFENYYIPQSNICEDAIVNIQIFNKLQNIKIQKFDIIIYNYDRRTSGIITRLNARLNYTIYTDYPIMSSILWIEDFINKNNKDKDTNAAFFFWVITTGIIPYLRYNNKIKKDEAAVFYSKYYLPCIKMHKIGFIYKPIIPIFHFSIYLGKMYVFGLNRLESIRYVFMKYFK